MATPTNVSPEGLEQLTWLSNQGCMFALPKGRTKTVYDDGWQNTPHTLDEAIIHANRLGNVAILVGKYSSDIYAIDIDVAFDVTLERLGPLANTAKIVRDNRPGRGKLLYRVNCTEQIPVKAWKPDGPKTPPHVELLSNGRAAHCPPSEYKGDEDADYGKYMLIDREYGIKEISFKDLDGIWFIITGENVTPRQQRGESAEPRTYDADSLAGKVKAHWTALAVFEHFGWDTDGTRDEKKGEVRLLKRGGLLVNGQRWYSHSDEVGGDEIDAWSFCQTGKVFDRSDKEAFKALLEDMARAAGIPIPEARPKKKAKTYTNGHSSAHAMGEAEGGEEDGEQLPNGLEEICKIIDNAKKSEEGPPVQKVIRDLALPIGRLSALDANDLQLKLIETGLYSRIAAGKFIAACQKDAKKADKQKRPDDLDPDLPTIIGNERQLRHIVDETLDAAYAYNRENANTPGCYVHSGSLAKLIVNEHGRYASQHLNNPSAKIFWSRLANWVSYKSTPIFPPDDVINAVLNLGEWGGDIPTLEGISDVPTIGPGGVLHDKVGYSPNTRMFYSGRLHTDDTQPTPERVAWAKSMLLDELLYDFPFDSDASRAHAIALILLPFVRPMISGPTPLHLVDSPQAGTGKGLLIDVAGLISLGEEIAHSAPPRDDVEWRKLLTTALMNDAIHFSIDNANGPLTSVVFNTVLTQSIWNDRVLGTNTGVTPRIRKIWVVNGINVTPTQEIARRSIWIRIDANHETPWKGRKFKHPDLKRWVRQNLKELSAACVILVRHWVESGMQPYTGDAKGSYPQWTEVIGGILQAIGVDGFLSNDDDLYANTDDSTTAMTDFVLKWAEIYGGALTSTSELFKLASAPDPGTPVEPGDKYHNLLGGLLVGEKMHARLTSFGRLMKRYRDRVVGGYKILIRPPEHGSAPYFRLVSLVELQAAEIERRAAEAERRAAEAVAQQAPLDFAEVPPADSAPEPEVIQDVTSVQPTAELSPEILELHTRLDAALAMQEPQLEPLPPTTEDDELWT
ncbi:MAG TPA: hypothetical protein P5182_10450 [Myxococcota bacterium]|nr:hypothetical protein [Myxococcota bacterium]HRR74846.1 hypothetical protein [Myxococcota bacterium]